MPTPINIEGETNLITAEDLKKVLTRMILHLEAGINFFRNLMASAVNDDDSDSGTPTDEAEEAA